MSQKGRSLRRVSRQTLAEQVAAAIREDILEERWQAGDALPTEPELAEQFDVSRSVIRDATRMLVAQGLVEAQHGRGVFVTESQVEAFGEALLLALRREDATAWDVEQFEQVLFPEVCALAAEAVTEEEMAQIKTLAEAYQHLFEATTRANWETGEEGPSWDRVESFQPAMEAFRSFMEAIFAASHNKLLALLARPLLRLRSYREWQDEKPELDVLLETEAAFGDEVIRALASGDAKTAREIARNLVTLPPGAERAMRQTRIGDVPRIPLPYSPGRPPSG